MAWTTSKKRAHGVRYTGMYRDADGNARSAGTSSSKRAALKAAEDEESKVRLGMWRDPGLGAITLEQYFEEWIAERIMELNTELTYRSHYRAGIAPTFAHTRLADITVERVQKWVAAQRKRGTKPSTIKARLKTLQTVLAARKGKSALRDGKISANPCYGVSVPFEPEREVTIFDPDEFTLIVAALPPWYQAMAMTWLETGVRWGELQALTPADFTGTLVWVQRTVIEVGRKYSENGTRFRLKDYPKTRSRRRLRVSPELVTVVQALVEQRGLGPRDRLFGMWQRTDLGLVPKRTDVWADGLPMSRNHFNDAWKRAQAKAGVEYRRPYDLRASNISWALAGGAANDLPKLMEHTGHTQIQTVRRYMATLGEPDDTIVNALAAVKARYDKVQQLHGRRPA